MFSIIRPHQYVVLRLPSDAIKVEQIVPNTLINLGKYGSFHANQILGRPFHLTFEILDRAESQEGRELRVVSAAELHADTSIEEAETDGYTPSAVGFNGDDLHTLQPKSNVNILDDPAVQKLTMAEIEALKQDETGSSRELIAKIMRSHTTLDQKTAFSLAKYTLRKHKKYLKRFCVLPLDVAMMTEWMMNERDFGKVLEVRNEMLALIGSWANIHATGDEPEETSTAAPACRYLVVDDTGGLIVAAMAERMGVLNATAEIPFVDENEHTKAAVDPKASQRNRQQAAVPKLSKTLTLVHANSQPNLSLLRYFSFDANNPSVTHPLYNHLKTLSWLQLVDPDTDPAYQEPEVVSPEVLHSYKSSKRSTYHRKRRRWERMKSIIDETREGGFDGLVIASYTSPVSILHRLVPLLAGGAQVVVYSPHIEPLVELADIYSTARRTAFITLPEDAPERQLPSEEFPVDPTFLLTPTVQTARVRKWQVLPGRTHPLMMGKGGAEGYLFVGTRVIPAEGKISARGRAKRGKPKKEEIEELGQSNGSAGVVDESESNHHTKRLKTEEKKQGIDDNEVL